MTGLEHYLAAEDHLTAALAGTQQVAITNHLAAAAVHALLALVQSQAMGEAMAQFAHLTSRPAAADPWAFPHPDPDAATDDPDDATPDDPEETHAP